MSEVVNFFWTEHNNCTSKQRKPRKFFAKNSLKSYYLESYIPLIFHSKMVENDTISCKNTLEVVMRTWMLDFWTAAYANRMEQYLLFLED